MSEPVAWVKASDVGNCDYSMIAYTQRPHIEGGFTSLYPADAIERKDAAIAELVGVLELCRPYINAWPQCRDNLLLQVAAAIVKYDKTTTKETK